MEGLPDTHTDIFVSAKNDLLDSGACGRSYAVYRACEAAAARRQLPFIEHGLRPMTEEKKREIIKLYDDTVIALAGTLWKKN